MKISGPSGSPDDHGVAAFGKTKGHPVKWYESKKATVKSQGIGGIRCTPQGHYGKWTGGTTIWYFATICVKVFYYEAKENGDGFGRHAVLGA